MHSNLTAALAQARIAEMHRQANTRRIAEPRRWARTKRVGSQELI
jgi:hypothetical protein